MPCPSISVGQWCKFITAIFANVERHTANAYLALGFAQYKAPKPVTIVYQGYGWLKNVSSVSNSANYVSTILYYITAVAIKGIRCGFRTQ